MNEVPRNRNFVPLRESINFTYLSIVLSLKGQYPFLPPFAVLVRQDLFACSLLLSFPPSFKSFPPSLKSSPPSVLRREPRQRRSTRKHQAMVQKNLKLMKKVLAKTKVIHYTIIVKLRKEKRQMTNKELIKILRRFPKSSIIKINSSSQIEITAQRNQLNEWTLRLAVNEKLIDENEKSSCKSQNN